MNLAVVPWLPALVPMEELAAFRPDHWGGYEPTVGVAGGAPIEVATVLHPDDDATIPTVALKHATLRRFKFVLPGPEAWAKEARPAAPRWNVTISLFAESQDAALAAVVDGRLRAALPWVSATLYPPQRSATLPP